MDGFYNGCALRAKSCFHSIIGITLRFWLMVYIRKHRIAVKMYK